MLHKIANLLVNGTPVGVAVPFDVYPHETTEEAFSGVIEDMDLTKGFVQYYTYENRFTINFIGIEIDDDDVVEWRY